MTRLIFLVLAAGTIAQAQTATFDAIIRNGTILDGSGNPRFEADIAIRNGFIVAIGDRRRDGGE